MSTHLDSPRSPRDRGDGSHPAASADIADMMAMRAESHAGRAGEWASDAKRYADIAGSRSSTTSVKANTALWERQAIVAFVMIALGVVLGFALSVLGYVAVVRIVHDAVGSAEQRTGWDTRPMPPAVPVPSVSEDPKVVFGNGDTPGRS